jgi:uncharacterized peroxidase-related enzyme
MAAQEYRQPTMRGSSQAIEAANLPVVSEDTASPSVQRLYAQFRKAFSRPQVPGILQCFATHPPLLEHMMALAQSLLFIDGALDRQHKEMISVFVSSANQCTYCTDSHAYSFRTNGGSADALKAVLACDLESAVLTDRQQALLRFAQKVTENSQNITPGDVRQMRDAGWNDLQIAEAIHVTALFASFNRVVNAFGLPSQGLLRMFAEEEAHSE